MVSILSEQAVETIQNIAYLARLVDKHQSKAITSFNDVFQAGMFRRYLASGYRVTLDTREGLTIWGEIETGFHATHVKLFMEVKFSWPKYPNRSKLQIQLYDENETVIFRCELTFEANDITVNSCEEFTDIGAGRFAEYICEHIVGAREAFGSKGKYGDLIAQKIASSTR